MVQEFTEAEFITEFTEPCYLKMMKLIAETVTNSVEFRNDKPDLVSFLVLPIEREGISGCIIVEVYVNKVASELRLLKLQYSDEEMPDAALDRYNEFRRRSAQDIINEVPSSWVH